MAALFIEEKDWERAAGCLLQALRLPEEGDKPIVCLLLAISTSL
jgi:hypothetical protein